MIPRSVSESWFDKPSKSPKGKLSATKLRSSCSRLGIREILHRVPDELMDEKLSRQDEDEGHVVLDADGAAVTKLCHELLNHGRLEDTVLLDPAGRKER